MATATASIKRYITDREWIDANYDLLADRYDKQYIAVSDGRVVASAPSIAELKVELSNATLLMLEMPTVVYMTKDSDSFLL